jgi:hypothetical protein
VSGTGVKTNGIGFRTNAHLNLDVTMGDVMRSERAEDELRRARNKKPPKKPKATIGRPKGPSEPTKFPYAGRERNSHLSKVWEADE